MEEKLKELFGDRNLGGGKEGGSITFPIFLEAVERVELSQFFDSPMGKRVSKSKKKVLMEIHNLRHGVVSQQQGGLGQGGESVGSEKEELSQPTPSSEQDLNSTSTSTTPPHSLARFMWGTVKEILGTCNSVGCSVDGKSPSEVQQMIDDGDIVIPDE